MSVRARNGCEPARSTRGTSDSDRWCYSGRRILKALMVLAGVMAMLSNFGFNMTTALAGLGIGGIAIAFAAQKTLENLFGGVSVLADEAIHVGDVCRFGTTIGTVEDIGLRSTRVRTRSGSIFRYPTARWPR